MQARLGPRPGWQHPLISVERASPGEVADTARPLSSEAVSTRCDAVSRPANLVFSRWSADSITLSDGEAQENARRAAAVRPAQATLGMPP